MSKLTQKKLEIMLEKLEIFKNPKVKLEQYPIDAFTAANILFFAHFNGDIQDKKIVDLGCGTGRLAIGAALLGAREIIGVDIDEEAIEIAKNNSQMMNIDVNWIVSDVENIQLKADTVIMNTPFGVKKKHADREFLQKAFEVSDNVIYSLHKYSDMNRKFLITYMDQFCKVDKIIELRMKIPHQFKFHQKKSHEIQVDLFRLIIHKK
ncbi:MAG: METTL5 family protein [Candidatus Helarchaeota archaeon]